MKFVFTHAKKGFLLLNDTINLSNIYGKNNILNVTFFLKFAIADDFRDLRMMLFSCVKYTIQYLFNKNT